MPPSPTAAARQAARPPAALTAALAIVVVQAAGAAALVVARDDYGPGGKGLVLAMIGFGLACGAAARRLRAGGALGLLLFEVVGILVAIGADWTAGLRLALVASIAAVFVLVLSSLHAFPSPELP